MEVAQRIRRQLLHLDSARSIAINQICTYAERHKQQRAAHKRIHLADNLVDGQQRGKNIVCEDNPQPQRHVPAREPRQQFRRTVDKRHPDSQQQKCGKHNQHTAHSPAEICANNLGQILAIIAQRKHTREKVVRGAHKNAAHYNPQIGHRSVGGPHNGAEYRTQSGNIEKLNHVHAPRLQLLIVDTVGKTLNRRVALGRHTEIALHKAPIGKIARHKQANRY